MMPTESYQERMLREDCERVAECVRPVSSLAKEGMLGDALIALARARVALDAARAIVRRMCDGE